MILPALTKTGISDSVKVRLTVIGPLINSPVNHEMYVPWNNKIVHRDFICRKGKPYCMVYLPWSSIPHMNGSGKISSLVIQFMRQCYLFKCLLYCHFVCKANKICLIQVDQYVYFLYNKFCLRSVQNYRIAAI